MFLIATERGTASPAQTYLHYSQTPTDPLLYYGTQSKGLQATEREGTPILLGGSRGLNGTTRAKLKETGVATKGVERGRSGGRRSDGCASDSLEKEELLYNSIFMLGFLLRSLLAVPPSFPFAFRPLLLP